MTTTVGILNVTGYAGSELARLLHGHPNVRIAGVTGRSAAGKRLPEIFPHLWAIDLPIAEALDDVDLVFSALPHAAAAEQLVPYIEAGVPVIDLSADFRLKRVEEYEARLQGHASRAAPAGARRHGPAGVASRRDRRDEADRRPRLPLDRRHPRARAAVRRGPHRARRRSPTRRPACRAPAARSAWRSTSPRPTRASRRTGSTATGTCPRSRRSWARLRKRPRLPSRSCRTTSR